MLEFVDCQYKFLAGRLIEQGYELTLFKEDEINLETAFMYLTRGPMVGHRSAASGQTAVHAAKNCQLLPPGMRVPRPELDSEGPWFTPLPVASHGVP